jgi:hypothetical protein
MKSINKLLIAGAMIVSQVSIAAASGDRVGNGGNSIAAHFSTIATNVVTVWEDICLNQNDKEAFCQYVPDLKKALNKDSHKYVQLKAVQVSETESHPCQIDEDIREACNNGSDKIIITSDLWKNMSDNSSTDARRINLVLHEYFSAMELDSSDYYHYSMKVFGMLKRKGYDLSKLAKNEILPTSCSINIQGTGKSSNFASFEKEIFKKNYSLKSVTEKTRYNLSLASKCSDSKITSSCAIHTQIKDNYTNSYIYDEMLIEAGLAKSESKILSNMNEKISTKIKFCSNK